MVVLYSAQRAHQAPQSQNGRGAGPSDGQHGGAPGGMSSSAPQSGSVPPMPLPPSAHALVTQCVDRLVACLQPCPQSESRRYAIMSYIVDCIKRCFQGGTGLMGGQKYAVPRRVEAFPLGSVPLKAYLPDGDVDISIFAERGMDMDAFKEQWAFDLKSFLETELVEGSGGGGGGGRRGTGRGKGAGGSLQIEDVQIIQAEVKLVKCIVSGLAVDVSFNALGGLHAVAFLEWCDEQIGRQHLLKKSILLIKAWCYYESRLLGAHHGMLSSYALEMMVLFVINGYGAELESPLGVFYRFMQVFSEFDFDRYCLSILGPIELESFPRPQLDVLALPPNPEPLLDVGELRDAILRCSTKPEEAASAIACLSPRLSCTLEKQPCIQMNRKHVNIMDPLMPTNNLGRSVSKTTSIRMRMAFSHGAKSLTHVFMHQDPAIVSQRIALYFNNTWNSIHRVSFDNRSFSTSTGRLSPEYLFMSTGTNQRLAVGSTGGSSGQNQTQKQPRMSSVQSVPEIDVVDASAGKDEDGPGRMIPQQSYLSTQSTANVHNSSSENNSSSKHRRANSVTSTISIGSMTTIGSTVLAMQRFNPGGQSLSMVPSQGDTLASDMQLLMSNIEFARKCQEEPDPFGELDSSSPDKEIRTFSPMPNSGNPEASSQITYASIAAHGLTPWGSQTLSRRDSLSVNASVNVSPSRSPLASGGRDDGNKQTMFHRSDDEKVEELRDGQLPIEGEGVDAHSLSRKLRGVQLSVHKSTTTWSSIAAQKPRVAVGHAASSTSPGVHQQGKKSYT